MKWSDSETSLQSYWTIALRMMLRSDKIEFSRLLSKD